MKLQNIKYLALLFTIALMTGCAISKIDVIASPPPSVTISVASSPTPASIIKGKIAFTYWGGEKYDIYVAKIDGSELKNLTSQLPYSVIPKWSPDGKYIAFTSSTGTDQIYRMDADGSNLRQLTFGKSDSSSPVWSSDGKYIVFKSEQNNVLSDQGVPIPAAYIMNSDGSDQRRLTTSQDFVNAVSWYPNEDLVAVTVAGSGRYSLATYLISLDGVIQKQSLEFAVNEIPHWSPNGKFVLFSTTGRSNCSGIITMKIDGSDQNCLVIEKMFPPVQSGAASWSPDSKYIIFSSNRDGDYDIYIVRADGSGLTQLTNLPGDEISPVWSAKP